MTLAMSWADAFSSRRKISGKHFVALQNSEHGVSFSNVFGPFCSDKNSIVRIVATNMFHNFTRVIHRGIHF